MISFTPKGAPDFYGYYYTSDEAEIQALREHPYFGSIITLPEEEEEVVEPKKEYKATYEEVKRTQDANKVLIEKYGIAKEQLKSKADAVRIAEELNISFPNLG